MAEESEYETSSGEEESEEETSEEEESESEEEEKEQQNVAKDHGAKVDDKKQVVKQPEVKKEAEIPTSLSIPSAGLPQTRQASRPTSPFGQPRKMTHQRKQNLKSMMLNKARDDLKKEAEQQAEEKKAILGQRLESLPDVSGMDQQELMFRDSGIPWENNITFVQDLCRELSGKIDKVDEARYDVEHRVKKNDSEIEDLNQRIFDLRGKFKRPPLRRVRMSADQMLRALLGSKHKVSMDLRSNLKSVKKEETQKDDGEVKDWRENVEAKTGMEGKKSMFEGQ